MRCAFLFDFRVLAFFPLLSVTALASAPNPDNYPLRVHILKYTSQTDRRGGGKDPSGMPDLINGQGVADLFESGEPRGFEFTFSCTDPPKASSGYGSFPAKWKKKEKTLEILLPEAGKP